MILVVGATGVLGSEVVRKVLAAGLRVRAATRSPQAAQHLAQLGADVVAADLIDPRSLTRACEGVNAVVVAAHSLMGTGKYASSAVDGTGHLALIDAAKSAGVARFVYTSVRGATSDHPVEFFRTKAAAEQYLWNSGIDFTILRPSPFMEWHVDRLLGKSIVETGAATIFGRGTTPTNFIAAADVAHYAVAALLNDGMSGRTLEIGGPDNVTKRQIVELYERYTGRKAKVRYVPVGLMRVMSPLLRQINPVVSRLMAASVWGETTNQTFDVRRLPQDIPASLTRIDAFVREHARPGGSAA
jgi:NADH dehydrogenase